MSLNMYLGEVQAQTESMNASCTAIIESMEQVIQSIDSFVGDVVLQGKTYDSAKMFFLQTFRPLAQGIIYLCEELIHQNNAFPADFQAEVATVDVIEQEILEQIRELERMIAEVQSMSAHMLGMDALLQVYYAMKRKLGDKLERLYRFNVSSSDNYATAMALAADIAKGLAEVQSGKGFSPASGTFSTKELNMEWATPIQKITEDKARQAEKLEADNLFEDEESEKSMLEKAWDAIYYGSGQAVGYVIEGVPKIWNGVYIGSGQAVGDVIEGFPTLFEAETWLNARDAIVNYDETIPAMWNTLSDSFIRDVINGDAESIARWGTYAFMQVAGGGVLSGAKGVSRLGKVTTLAKNPNISKITQSISYTTSNLQITDRFAFAGESIVQPRFDNNFFRQTDKKISSYQFARGKSGSVNLGDIEYKIEDLLKMNPKDITDGSSVKPKYSTLEERIKIVPKNHGTWEDKVGESKFVSKKDKVNQYLDEANTDGVFYKSSMPDFSPFVKAEVEIDMTNIRDGKLGNFGKADEALAKQLSTAEVTITKTDIKKWRMQNRYTWHELNDCKTIQLVPTDINNIFKHLGGVGEINIKNKLGE